MILGEQAPREGMLPAAVAVIVAALVLLVVAGVGLVRCTQPVPPVAIASPPPATKAITTGSSGTMTEQEIEVVIPPRRAPQPITLESGSITEFDGREDGNFGHLPITHEEPIIIRIRQTVQASASAGASASVDQIGDVTGMVPDHARLGVIVGPFPGAIAFSYQLAALEVPSDVFGTKLQLGLDVEGNLSQVGGGVSVGSKAFATAGGFVGWLGPGWYVGLGMRF